MLLRAVPLPLLGTINSRDAAKETEKVVFETLRKMQNRDFSNPVSTLSLLYAIALLVFIQQTRINSFGQGSSKFVIRLCARSPPQIREF